MNVLTLPEVTSFEHLFFPAAQPAGKLMVVLHGLGDSAEGFIWMPQHLGLPHLDILLVNAPNPYFMGYAWYDIEDPRPGVLHARNMLGQLLTELAAQGWKNENIILFGFSQGCLISIDFALRYGQPLAGIIGVSGYALLEGNLKKEIHAQARKQNWLVTHGHLDGMLPLERTRDQMEALRGHGIPIQWHEFDKEHTIDMEYELPLLREWIAEQLGFSPA